MPSHALAASFLERRLAGLGLEVARDSFYDSTDSIGGTNVLAEQTGSRFPQQKFILCAHYDAMAEDTQDSLAPGADDNATGVVAVLEAARLLSRYQTDHTVLYALWDCEEAGILGSDAYAKAARASGDSIICVVNLDMLGTDTNNDSLMYVAGGTARELADTIGQLCQLYQIGLKPVCVFPGIQSSDHGSFIRQKYRAIMLIEYLPTDFSPVNHTSLDRIANLNLDYFHRQTKLAVATIAFLAGVSPPSSVGAAKNVAPAFCLEPNYPNPFNPSTTIRYGLPHKSIVQLAVYNTLGQEVALLVQGEQEAGYHEVRFDASGLSSGVYFYRLQTGDFVQTRKLLLLR
jgi:Zn-dependent M28 family amino/carboxypeptidase